MKVLGICGSIASNSVNLRFLKAVEKLLPEGVTFEVQTLHNIPMYTPDHEKQAESVQQLCKKIAEADRIIIATPEYNYSIPGVLKNAIDWISRDPSKPFDRKTTAIMGASPGNIGTARSQYHLRQIGVFLNINFLNKPEVLIGGCNDKIDQNGNITDEKTKNHIGKMVAALLADKI